MYAEYTFNIFAQYLSIKLIIMFRFENIDVSFNGRRILKDFSLEVREGEKVLLYGKSGIGKSTLIKMLLGFVKPESGKIFYRDRLLDRNTIWQLRNETAYISQDMEIGSGKISDYFELIFSYKNNSHLKFSQYRFNELAGLFELPDGCFYNNMDELSGGEKQRLMIITALMLERNIFLLDEITSGLDLKLKQKVTGHFLGKDEWTEIIISHDSQWLSQPGVTLVNMGSESVSN